MTPTTKLLSGTDAAPVRVLRPDAPSPFLLVCDHAGRLVPKLLGDLGVGPADWERHIAWDIGIAGVGERLSKALDATCILQTYSRLVIDCNREPGHPTSIAAVSDGTPIPANADLPAEAAAERAAAIFAPYHQAIEAAIDARRGAPVALVALHSFTPIFGGVSRPWHAGVLYNRDPSLSHALAPLLRQGGLLVGDNEPYRLTDDSDYTVPVHAERRGLPYLELEIRQDLIADAAGQASWAAKLAELLPLAWEAVHRLRRQTSS